jgi:hypothetical protein
LICSRQGGERLQALRTRIREGSRLLGVSAGPDRIAVLEQLCSLRRELSGLVARGEERSQEADALALMDLLLVGGGALVVPVVTAVGGKLLLATAGSIVTVLDLPQLTSQRVESLMNGAEDRMG